MLVGGETLVATFTSPPPPDAVGRVASVNHFMLGVTTMWTSHRSLADLDENRTKLLGRASLPTQRFAVCPSRIAANYNKISNKCYILCDAAWKVLYVGDVLRSVAHVCGRCKRETCVLRREFSIFRRIG